MARTSKTLIPLPSVSAERHELNRYTMKMDLRNESNQFILKLQVANAGGVTRQLGQFVLNFEKLSDAEDPDQARALVRYHQGPFIAMMFLRGIMQVIEWYGGQNVWLSEGCIRVLLGDAKTYWHDMIHMQVESRLPAEFP
jgi:hypothetical protein